tara:strand:- start:17521 stop:17793 length:273 start_codon:yes stop_codon:yes gene_type:complete
MEAQPPHSRASITLHPMRSAFPPDGAVRVAPQTEHAITLVALEKITTSAPQSRHDTFRKLLAIIPLTCQLIQISLLFYTERNEPFQSQYI